MAVQRPGGPHELTLDLLEHHSSRTWKCGPVADHYATSNQGLVRDKRAFLGRFVGRGLNILQSKDIRGSPIRYWRVEMLRVRYFRSSFMRSVLMANAASAPSAAATITHCTARDASPAT